MSDARAFHKNPYWTPGGNGTVCDSIRIAIQVTYIAWLTHAFNDGTFFSLLELLSLPLETTVPDCHVLATEFAPRLARTAAISCVVASLPGCAVFMAYIDYSFPKISFALDHSIFNITFTCSFSTAAHTATTEFAGRQIKCRIHIRPGIIGGIAAIVIGQSNMARANNKPELAWATPESSTQDFHFNTGITYCQENNFNFVFSMNIDLIATAGTSPMVYEYDALIRAVLVYYADTNNPQWPIQSYVALNYFDTRMCKDCLGRAMHAKLQCPYKYTCKLCWLPIAPRQVPEGTRKSSYQDDYSRHLWDDCLVMKELIKNGLTLPTHGAAARCPAQLASSITSKVAFPAPPPKRPPRQDSQGNPGLNSHIRKRPQFTSVAKLVSGDRKRPC